MSTIESIADDGIEHARYCTEQARWLNALAASICDALEGGKARPEIREERAKELASLISYLAHDLTHYSERRASEMEKELAAAQAQGGAE
ncbi:hypothetical protein M8R19_17960 [Pseudomonas sp. R3.Fl]|jgi:hypothetical protein|uniref:hypothetical protein n=1 Tax=Pseudomonas sp. R3.Fl TaxID=2928708 RepID=UPI00201E1947|nr:hypothetical protein [Pseudomonas sp. R3.Fl]MCL6690597.1 hypothetical protein [Pseudomonas sp. R3.Fl]